MSDTKSDNFHLPEGINYECTGCGKCCGGWSVPLTEEDYHRISDIDWAKESDRYIGKALFRELKDYESKGTPYTNAIKEGSDGHCPFLVDNLCFIHSKYGAETKPSICQLFPYSFNKTPSGVYATVSFYSMGAVNNSGKSLIEQRPYLEKKFAEFKKLYPDHEPNWSQIQLSTGFPITWETYLEYESKILSYINDRTMPMEQRFLNASTYLARTLAERRASAAGAAGASTNGSPNNASPPPPAAGASSSSPQLSSAASLNWLDKHLLTGLHKIYFPAKRLGRGEGDFNFYRFIYQVIFQGIIPGTKLQLPGRSYSFEELESMPFPSNEDQEIEDLIYRYFFSRIFGKHYFGAGFGQLTLISGFNHLAIVFALLKLQSKAIAKSRDVGKVSYLDVAAAVRLLEKRMGETNLDGMAAATYETLMHSPRRVARVLAHS